MLRRPLGQLNRDILALCGIIFLADVSSGFLSPTFPLYAERLGVSLALLGLLATLGGVAQVLTSLPFGMLSDRVGRPRVLLLGAAAFSLALLLLALAHGFALLLAGRIILGVAMAATFQIAAAHLGDITEPSQRSFAFGLSTTAMGIGFTVGPLLGTQIAAHAGTRLAYVVGAGITLGAGALAWRIHRRFPERPPGPRPRGLGQLGEVLRHRRLMLACFGTLLMSFTFTGAVTTYFPIYGDRIHLTEAEIGGMFAIRAFVSTLGRLPNGLVSRRLGSRSVMLAAIALDLLVMFGIARTTNPAWLAVLLGLDGLAFGAYIVSGQTFVADHAAAANRGTANGVYSTASSVGSMTGPLMLGLVASQFGVARVFSVTGWTLAAGLALSLAATVASRQEARPLTSRSAPLER